MLIRRQSAILHQYSSQLRQFLDEQLKIVRKLSKKKEAYKIRLEGCLGVASKSEEYDEDESGED